MIRETGITLEDTLNYFQKINSAHQTGLDRAYLYAFNRLTPEEQNILSTAALTSGVSMSPEWLVAALGSQEAEHFVERLKALGLLVANSPRLCIPPGIASYHASERNIPTQGSHFSIHLPTKIFYKVSATSPGLSSISHYYLIYGNTRFVM